MHRKSTATIRLAGLFAVAGLATLPGRANALTSVEGTTLGDQGYYWNSPQESWIFPHRIHNVDNRAMLQHGTGTQTLTHTSVLNGTGLGGEYYNLLPVQTGSGAGLVVEMLDDINLGLWVSQYTGPGLDAFVQRGVTATGWGHSPDDLTVNDIAGLDPACAGGGCAGTNIDGLDAGRKMDLFIGYLMADMGLETGIHLFWGSNNRGLMQDDSIGPINIDEDSDPNDASGPLATSVEQKHEESTFKVTEMGMGLGAGYTAIEDLRIDFGLDWSIMGVNWSPTGMDDYVSAGGMGLALNLRSHFNLTDQVVVGGFFRFNRSSYNLEPTKQRDGGDLEAFYDADDNTLPNPPSTMPSGDFATGHDELTPVKGIKYSETMSDWQLAGLVKYEPNSRATIYASMGVGNVSASEKTSVDDTKWYDETTSSLLATPFIQLAMAGRVTKNVDLFFGASKRWQQWTQNREAFDSRIPDDTDAAGGGTPAAGNEENTNGNRRTITGKDTADFSPTHIDLGARVTVGPVQWVTHLNPATLLNGPYFLTGASTGTFAVWTSLIYDWDYDQDKGVGNGSIRPSPHTAEAAPAAGPATGGSRDSLGHESGDEVFDS